MMEAAQVEIVVKRCPEAVAEVRRFVRLALDDWDMDDYVACLVASELVTNTVRYASGDEVTVRLARTDDGALWLEVEDAAGTMPRVQEAEPADESGRGLFVVEQLSRRWGVRPLAGNVGKVVFAVLES
ncbi:ATP-binding protein [Actinoallomurus purpureus]|uniref:ATP-binding protein n=1 Tax=Actinoallomurus purpureus TaxID=478114 RepID=UPI002092BC99|nr:ATP-binding protein [Actinoallomurus purpureus]MCO6006098.1 ATP-binding protein [Actinoallomurus purpureus]